MQTHGPQRYGADQLAMHRQDRQVQPDADPTTPHAHDGVQTHAPHAGRQSAPHAWSDAH